MFPCVSCAVASAPASNNLFTKLPDPCSRRNSTRIRRNSASANASARRIAPARAEQRRVRRPPQQPIDQLFVLIHDRDMYRTLPTVFIPAYTSFTVSGYASPGNFAKFATARRSASRPPGRTKTSTTAASPPQVRAHEAHRCLSTPILRTPASSPVLSAAQIPPAVDACSVCILHVPRARRPHRRERVLGALEGARQARVCPPRARRARRRRRRRANARRARGRGRAHHRREATRASGGEATNGAETLDDGTARDRARRRRTGATWRDVDGRSGVDGADRRAAGFPRCDQSPRLDFSPRTRTGGSPCTTLAYNRMRYFSSRGTSPRRTPVPSAAAAARAHRSPPGPAAPCVARRNSCTSDDQSTHGGDASVSRARR